MAESAVARLSSMRTRAKSLRRRRVSAARRLGVVSTSAWSSVAEGIRDGLGGGFGGDEKKGVAWLQGWGRAIGREDRKAAGACGQAGTSSGEVLADAVLLELAVEGGFADAEQARRRSACRR